MALNPLGTWWSFGKYLKPGDDYDAGISEGYAQVQIGINQSP